ncbi:hypothetical protein GCM10011579_034700 [Streptomyces albiflavescens]|uniref:Uncharacterized protein n=1 Tax=Streptomyces albiflavescens TaxID=1623582 RepID=A0A917Y2A0_9ACTN|nr:hypothetical protein [Streptomyces albiflavescens]GGN64821.1 hypothetical protein GCM10011579_034700 [Streptomyces albiflavescens]
MQGAAGRVFLTGHPTGTPRTKGTGVTRVNAPSNTDVSTLGRLAVHPVLTPGVRAGMERVKNAGKGFTKAEASAQDGSAQAPASVPTDAPTTVTSTAHHVVHLVDEVRVRRQLERLRAVRLEAERPPDP